MNAELRAAYATLVMARREAEEAELALRQVALAVFAKTGKTPVAPGISVHIGHSGRPYAIISKILWPQAEAGIE